MKTRKEKKERKKTDDVLQKKKFQVQIHFPMRQVQMKLQLVIVTSSCPASPTLGLLTSLPGGHCGTAWRRQQTG